MGTAVGDPGLVHEAGLRPAGLAPPAVRTPPFAASHEYIGTLSPWFATAVCIEGGVPALPVRRAPIRLESRGVKVEVDVDAEVDVEVEVEVRVEIEVEVKVKAEVGTLVTAGRHR